MSASEAAPKRRILAEVLVASFAVTMLVTAASRLLPTRHVATAVGGVFLAATWLLVFRKDDATVTRAGLALGGLVLPGKLDLRFMALATARALGWALLLAALVFVPFYFGWRFVWKPTNVFAFGTPAQALASEAFGQLVIIALPEEAFYRGYVQSRLDDVWPPRTRVLGAAVGPSLVVTSVVFALGHVATIPDPARLAVFFPSLLFGWMRARTGGIGAACVFHALCNVYSEVLGRGFGVY